MVEEGHRGLGPSHYLGGQVAAYQLADDVIGRSHGLTVMN